MTKGLLLFFLTITLHSCSDRGFEYPASLKTNSQQRQYDKAVWLIYKFDYKLPVYEVDSPFKTPSLSLKKIDLPFVACDIILKGVEKIGDTLVFDFRSRHNRKQIAHGPHEDDGIPNMTFIGSSDSIRSMDNFYVINFPLECDSDCDSTLKSGYVKVNSFVYDTLGESEFIEHIKSNKKLISPTLRFLCEKKGVFD